MKKQALTYTEDMIAAIYYQVFDDEINYVKKKKESKIPTPGLKKEGHTLKY